MALNPQAARSGAMSYTNQGLLYLAIGGCLAPFTGGMSLVYGACHLGFGVAADHLNQGSRSGQGASGPNQQQ